MKNYVSGLVKFKAEFPSYVELHFNEDVSIKMGDVIVLEPSGGYDGGLRVSMYIIRKEEDGEERTEFSGQDSG